MASLLRSSASAATIAPAPSPSSPSSSFAAYSEVPTSDSASSSPSLSPPTLIKSSSQENLVASSRSSQSTPEGSQTSNQSLALDDPIFQPSAANSTPRYLRKEQKLGNAPDLSNAVVAPHDDFWSTLLIWEGSVIESIYGRVAMVIAINIALCLTINVFGVHLPVFSYIPHSLVGLPLGLLLVFRTNSAYDRFWEGRKAWGTIVINSRAFARFVATLSPMHRSGDKLINLYLAFAYALKHRLRGSQNSDQELEELADMLVPDTLHMIMKVNNRPSAIMRLISEFILDKVTTGEMTEYLLPSLQDLITQCITAQTACERIINTPMPLPYLIQIRQLVFIYVLSLPFIMVGLFGNWASLAGSFLLSFGLLGIEEAGKIIENPFGTDESDLPLERYCNVIETDMRQITAFGRTMLRQTNAAAVARGQRPRPPPDGRFRAERLVNSLSDMIEIEELYSPRIGGDKSESSSRRGSKYRAVRSTSSPSLVDVSSNHHHHLGFNPADAIGFDGGGIPMHGCDPLGVHGMEAKPKTTKRVIDENEVSGADPTLSTALASSISHHHRPSMLHHQPLPPIQESPKFKPNHNSGLPGSL